MLESNAYKTYYAFTSGKKIPKLKYIRKKVDSDTSPKQKPVQATKCTRLKKKAKVAKSDKKKQPAKKPKAKGLAILSEVALTKAGYQKKQDTISQFSYKWLSKDEEKDDENYSDDISDEGDDDNDGNNGNDGDDDDANDDDKQEGDDTNNDDEETDSDRTESDRIKIPILDQSTTEYYEEEEEKIDDEETMNDDDDDEVTKELYEDVNVNLGYENTKITNTDQGASEQQNKADKHVQSYSVSFDFTSKLLNLENPSPADNEIASLMETSAHHAMAVPEITFGFTTTIPPPPPFFNPLLQQATPTPTPTTFEAIASFPSLLDFSYVFRFNDRVTNLEKDLLEIKQVEQYAQALSSIVAIVDCYMDNKLGEAINKAIQAHNLDYRQKAQDEKNAYIELIDIKEEAATSLSEFELTKILIDTMEKNKGVEMKETKIETPPLDQTEGRKEENRVKMLSPPEIQGQRKRSLQAPLKTPPNLNISLSASLPMQRSQEVTKADWFKKPERPPTLDPDWSKRQHVDFRPPQTWISQVAHAEEPPTSFDELNDTSFDFSAFVMNRLKIPNLTQEILVGPAFNLLKGTCKSIMELEYHFEEYSKATTKCLDWYNPKNKPYPFDLRKPLSLIQDHQGRQIIPQDYFINNDLEYLKGRYLSRRYSTSMTKTKAATYDLKWIEDLDPKRQSFYEYASNMTSSKDVYSKRRIIVVTRLKIMKKYDYSHLEEIEVRRDDQKQYMFREGDFKRLRLQDIEDMLLLLVQ
ncbi:hypothetical protein Tco_1005531 [Tanacetum coccineum]|uniref:Uncharacterized protein n=1 Tax=Tanacetum coccineum TaxID=301880 RepID=A0ABQ5FGD8_9ASTR